jgi:hypothetical protein
MTTLTIDANGLVIDDPIGTVLGDAYLAGVLPELSAWQAARIDIGRDPSADELREVLDRIRRGERG